MGVLVYRLVGYDGHGKKENLMGQIKIIILYFIVVYEGGTVQVLEGIILFVLGSRFISSIFFFSGLLTNVKIVT